MLTKLFDRLIYRNPFIADAVKAIFGSKYVGNSRIYRFLTLRAARLYDVRHGGVIRNLHIETMLGCNARCVMCAHAYSNMSGTMGMELYKKVIDESAGLAVKKIKLGNYGEVLLDPDFIERVRYLRKYGMTYEINTNASLLTESLAREMLQLGGLELINISVNGFSKDVYEKVMQGLDRDQVYKNVQRFLELKTEYRRKDLCLIITCVKTKFTRPELKEFIAFWKQFKGVDRINIADLWDRVGPDADINKVGELGALQKRGLWPTPCKEIWDNIYVYHDGRVAPCCPNADKRTLIIGDVSKDPLTDVFKGSMLSCLRAMHLDDKRSLHPVCGKCSYHSLWFA